MPIDENGKYQMPEGILKEKYGKAEYRLHVACINYLRGHIKSGRNIIKVKRPFPELFSPCGNQRFSHIAQGRDETEGFFLKQMGLRRGLLDLIFWHQKFIVGFIDFKVDTGLAPAQKQFWKDIELCGVKLGTATSVAQMRDVLIGWGLTCEQPVVTEPPISKEEAQARYLEMMRPI